ncbi:MAG: hypothetical protein ACRDUB_02170 [Mycobacterium sp.]
MRDSEERAASLALRDGDQKEVSRAVDWYRRHDRLHCGDEATMAADALAAYKADIAAGRDALLLCDTREIAGALNRRLHREAVAAHAPTVTGINGYRIGVGDLTVTRHNDASIPVRDQENAAAEASPVRNGQRWLVEVVNPANNRLGARRLEDNVVGVFNGGYVQEHISHGYAVTVHSAQGVTADTSHAVLSENAERRLLYVAMTRGRHTNTAQIYQPTGEAGEYSHQSTLAAVPDRGTGHDAAELVRGIIANDSPVTTAHGYGAGLSDLEVAAVRVRAR